MNHRRWTTDHRQIMDPLQIIQCHYSPGSRAYDILIRHSRLVADKALAVAARVGHLKPDLAFIEQAALLHDIGICLTHSPSLDCFGDEPYIRHGILGRELLEAFNLPRHARVCERHVGVGITPADIDRQRLPLPRRDMRPVTVEEQIICYADKFFSKDGDCPDKARTVTDVVRMLDAYGPDQSARFTSWVRLFEAP